MVFLKILGIIWIPCGFLAYGLIKGLIRANCYNLKEKYKPSDERLCRICFLGGPLSLLFALEKRQEAHFVDSKIFCFRMPKELCEPRPK